MISRSSLVNGRGPGLTCAQNFLVAIVACVAASVVCASPSREAMYSAQKHRALVGHVTASHSGVTLLQCAVLCLIKGEARCGSFNYDKTSRICQLNGERVEDFPERLVEDSDFSYYGRLLEEAGTDLPAPEWQLVFKGVAGQGVKLYDMWTAPSWDESLSVGGSWRDDSLFGAWNSSELKIAQVKLSLYDSADGVSSAEIIFNGTDSDTMNWFARDHLISSPWPDLASTATNYFSLTGHDEEERRFFINYNFPGCSGDEGWLVATDAMMGTDCDWERPTAAYPYPIILYSKMAGKCTWQDVLTPGTHTVGRANYLTIHIKVE